MGQIVSQMHCVMYMLLSNLAGAIFVIVASSSLPNIDHQYKHFLITKLRQNIFSMLALFLLNNNFFKKLFLSWNHLHFLSFPFVLALDDQCIMWFLLPSWVTLVWSSLALYGKLFVSLLYFTGERFFLWKFICVGCFNCR